MSVVARKLVSKKKKRYINQEHDFDLDLSYINTPKTQGRIIAMGIPSEGLEAQFRNKMEVGHLCVHHACDSVLWPTPVGSSVNTLCTCDMV